MLSVSDGWLGDSAGRLYSLDALGYHEVASPTTAAITDLDATSPADAWATTASGQVLRWDGAVWRVAAVLGDKLVSVSALSPAEAWVVGYPGVVMRWDGATWRAMPPPEMTGRESPARVLALSSSSVWLATNWYWSPTGFGYAYEWTGELPGWQRRGQDFNGVRLTDLAALSPNNVWLSGFTFDTRYGYGPWLSIWSGSGWRLIVASQSGGARCT